MAWRSRSFFRSRSPPVALQSKICPFRSRRRELTGSSEELWLSRVMCEPALRRVYRPHGPARLHLDRSRLMPAHWTARPARFTARRLPPASDRFRVGIVSMERGGFSYEVLTVFAGAATGLAQKIAFPGTAPELPPHPVLQYDGPLIYAFESFELDLDRFELRK